MVLNHQEGPRDIKGRVGMIPIRMTSRLQRWSTWAAGEYNDEILRQELGWSLYRIASWDRIAHTHTSVFTYEHPTKLSDE